MLLAVDIGNTNLHLGLWRDDKWEITWRARTVVNKMGDEYAVLLRNFLSEVGINFNEIQNVVIASVVPELTNAFSTLTQRYLGVPALIVDHTTHIGVQIDIDAPQQVGPDRIVNAAAVHALYGGGPAIVIDFGTATTFDVISHDGAYLGGAIAPGINIAFDALVSRSARLHKTELKPPPSPIGKNTDQALQSGIFLGYLSLIEGLVKHIKSELTPEDHTKTQVIGTGGLATLFNEYCPAIDQVADLLTLEGLRVIWELNHPD